MLAPSQLAMSLALFVGSAHCARVQFAQHRIAPWPAHRGQISALLQRGPRRCRRLCAAARGAPRSTGAYLRPGLVCLEPHWQPPEGAASRRRIRGVGAPAARYADRRCSIKRLWKRHLVKAGNCWACRGTSVLNRRDRPARQLQANSAGRPTEGRKRATRQGRRERPRAHVRRDRGATRLRWAHLPEAAVESCLLSVGGARRGRDERHGRSFEAWWSDTLIVCLTLLRRDQSHSSRSAACWWEATAEPPFKFSPSLDRSRFGLDPGPPARRCPLFTFPSPSSS